MASAWSIAPPSWDNAWREGRGPEIKVERASRERRRRINFTPTAQAVRGLGSRPPRVSKPGPAAKLLADLSPAAVEMDKALLASQLEANRLRRAYSQVICCSIA